jgi:hypothetical protein
MRKSSQAHLVVIQPVAAPVEDCPRSIDDCGMVDEFARFILTQPEPDLEYARRLGYVPDGVRFDTWGVIS